MSSCFSIFRSGSLSVLASILSLNLLFTEVVTAWLADYDVGGSVACGVQDHSLRGFMKTALTKAGQWVEGMFAGKGENLNMLIVATRVLLKQIPTQQDKTPQRKLESCGQAAGKQQAQLSGFEAA